MADDPVTILLSDEDTPPAAEAAPKRGRGRPKGSKAAPAHTGERLAGVNEMADILSKLLGLASVLLAFALVGGDYAQAIALEPGEARDIAEPAARLLRKSRLARQASALALKGSDIVALTTALAGYLLRVWPIVAEIQAQKVSGHANQSRSARPIIRTPEPGAGAAAAAQPANPASNGASNGHAVAVPFGLSDSDANQFAAWAGGNLGNAFPPTAAN